jgi:cobyrinic acid a,c-diamide synthase
LGGVILNRVAPGRHEQLLREALADIGVPVLGVIHRHALATAGRLPNRDRGVALVVHREIEALRSVRRLSEVIAEAVDLERLIGLARSAPRLSAEPWSPHEAVQGASPTGDVSGPAAGGGRPVVARPTDPGSPPGGRSPAGPELEAAA